MIDTDGADPGHPHPGLDDTIDIEWVDRRQALAGLLRVSVRPSAGATWFLAVVHQQGAAPVVVFCKRQRMLASLVSGLIRTRTTCIPVRS